MISKATETDIPQLNNLVNSAYRGESSKKGWTTEADLLGGQRVSEKSLQATLSKPNITILKYVEEDTMKGCVLLEEYPEKLYLGMLTVSPELQGGGIGKVLLEAAEAQAKQRNIPKISMTVISIRHELIAYYERRGYKKTGETEPFPMQDPDFGLPKQFLEFVVMEKIINQA